MVSEAYHAPTFQSNILSVGVLSLDFVVIPHRRCEYSMVASLCILKIRLSQYGKLGYITATLLWRWTSANRRNRWWSSTLKKTKNELALDLHERTGHLKSSRYQNLARSTSSVPYFQRSVLDSLTCSHCITGKMKWNPLVARARSVSTTSLL